MFCHLATKLRLLPLYPPARRVDVPSTSCTLVSTCIASAQALQCTFFTLTQDGKQRESRNEKGGLAVLRHAVHESPRQNRRTKQSIENLPKVPLALESREQHVFPGIPSQTAKGPNALDSPPNSPRFQRPRHFVRTILVGATTNFTCMSWTEEQAAVCDGQS